MEYIIDENTNSQTLCEKWADRKKIKAIVKEKKELKIRKNEEKVVKWFDNICEMMLSDEKNYWSKMIREIEQKINSGEIYDSYTLTDFHRDCITLDPFGPKKMSFDDFIEVLKRKNITSPKYKKYPTIVRKIEKYGHLLDQCHILVRLESHTGYMGYIDKISVILVVKKNYRAKEPKCVIS